ncbi:MULTISPECIES: aldehyde dehydrogenase family protein [Clostridium]|uniref:Aldehyde dehydrogenase family protein n=1 Tax=Clostridium frigoriphilum TaxID=443253 RepID=A0ABU7UJ09_9CLOT|nr:aldehyde dehydrogenase family protein [Clostridium sp. DSM 17811]MBU3099203.1 aldehyde dehydrogenase EutE [Clostridium sp. DSM 17811]
MEIKNDEISAMVEKVLQEMNRRDLNISESDGVFDDMDEAIEAASIAQKQLICMSISQREELIAAMRKAILDNATKIADICVEDTGMGRKDHKYLKLKLVANKTPGTEVLKTMAISGDKGLTLIEMGPFGVIGGITPSTNPSATVMCNSIGMIASGNAAVFSPHPGAIESCLISVRVLNKAITDAGGPRNLITTLSKPSLESTDLMINNPKIRLVVATGGPFIVKKVLSSGKKAIGAGAGNPPVVVDETADIVKAARDIIAGCCFDNNLPCIAEKEAIVVESVYEKLIAEMLKNGNVYELDEQQKQKVLDVVMNKTEKNGKIKYGVNKNFVGKDATVILAAAGIEAPKGVECLICRAENLHPFVQEELMMPILAIVKVKDVDEAINTAVLDEHGNRHTAMMHSKNIDNLTKMSRLIDTTIFVKNAPSYAGIGFGGEGWTTFTIAGPTGEGITNATSFTRQRRCTMVDSFRII